jgi:hypothetical protein
MRSSNSMPMSPSQPGACGAGHCALATLSIFDASDRASHAPIAMQ